MTNSSLRSFRFFRPALVWAFIVGVLTFGSLAQAQDTGSVTGRVLNEATGDYLKNAIITLVGAERSTVADVGGAFTLTGLPAGVVRLRASYTGLDPVEVSVTVESGRTVVRDFSLTSKEYQRTDVVKLGAFVVATEKEGQARALMDQRAALNQKNVLSTDVYGNVAEGNVAEFLKYLPGMSLDMRESDVAFVRIRGFDPVYAGLTMDGNPVASGTSSNLMAQGRAFEFEALSINNVETIEVTKVPLADADGSSGAGVINMKSRRAFDRKGRNVAFSYALVGNSLLPLTLGESGAPRNKLSHPLKPSYSLSYSDVYFDRRLGVSADFGVSNTISMMQRAGASYTFNNDVTDNATEVPRIASVEFKDGPKETTRRNASINIDYKLSDAAYVGFRWSYSDFDTWVYDRLVAFASAGFDTTKTNTLGDQYAVTNANTFARLRGGFFNKISDTTNLSIPFGYKRGDFTLDGSLAQSIGRNWYYMFDHSAGNPPDLLLRNISYRVQNSNPTGTPYYTFTQLTGPGNAPVTSANSVFKVGNYPDPLPYGTFVNSPRYGKDTIWSASANAQLARNHWKIPTVIKTGFAVRQRVYNEDRFQYTYNYVPNDRAVTNRAEDKFPLVISNLTNFVPEFPDRFAIMDYVRSNLGNPTLFTRTAANLAADEQARLQGLRDFKEEVDALYAMATLKFGRLDVVPGLRFERFMTAGKSYQDIGDRAAKAAAGTTDTNSIAYRQARYGQRIAGDSSYSNLFSNLQTRYRLTPNLRLLAAYRESIQRPSPGNLLPGITSANDAAVPLPIVTINNPDLKPEQGKTFNIGGDFYFEPAGVFSLYWFRQDFKNKITRPVAANRPVAGPEGVFGEVEYAGWAVDTPINVANPTHMSGIEMSYRQQLSFLGRYSEYLRGLSIGANFTYLRPDQLANFTNTQLRTGSGSLNYRYKRFSVLNNFTWQGVYPNGNPNATTGIQGYRDSRFQVDSTLAIDLTKNLQFTIFGRNVFNEPDVYFLSKERHIVNSYIRYGTYWSFGIRGRY
ncbi:MAG: TonB-dependent receptor [Opitutaceae bacterium]|nr:TonB-dependent receptor [Opitutaceae bacterium]